MDRINSSRAHRSRAVGFSVQFSSVQSHGPLDAHRCRQLLIRRRGRLDLAHDVHAFHDASERGESLPIGITLAAEVQFRLRANADEELILSRVGIGPGHGDGAVFVLQPGVAGPFQHDRLVQLLGLGRVRPGLDDFDLDPVVEAGCPSSRCGRTRRRCRIRRGRIAGSSSR